MEVYKMKLFKNIDERLSDVGFIKTKDDKYGASYERKVIGNGYSYIQNLDLVHKADGNHLIQSSQKEVNSDGFNNMVGLSMYESRLALRKMKQMGWKEVR